ncbi:MAG: hypothetical protein R3F33_18090 [Planctomycetota bacterium]
MKQRGILLVSVVLVLGAALGFLLLRGPGAEGSQGLSRNGVEDAAAEGTSESSLAGAAAGVETGSGERYSLVPPKTEVEAPPAFVGQELVPWTITVRAERNAAPLADAEVLAWIDGQQAQARSDGEGKAQLQVPAGRAARLEVRATGFVPVRRPMLRSPEPVLVRMAQSGAIVGTYGKGEEGLEARLLAIDDDAVLERKKLDGNGAFRFADLIPGRYRVVLGPGVYVMAKEVWVQPGRETRVQWIVSEQRIDVPIVVLQTDSDQPVAGAELALYYHALGVPRELEGEADWRGETDAQGRARVPVAAGVRSNLRITAPWGTRTDSGYLDASAWTEQAERTFKLAGPARLAGVVLHADETPAPYATVRYGILGSSGPVNPGPRSQPIEVRQLGQVECDGAGAFEIASVPSNLMLWVSGTLADEAGRTLQGTNAVTLRPGQERTDLKVVLAGGGRLLGRVVDSDGAPWVGLDWKLTDILGREFGAGQTDGEGRFEAEGWSRYRGQRLIVQFDQPGESPDRRRVNIPRDLQPGEDGILVVEDEYVLERRVLLQGYVLDGEGNGVGKVAVRVERLRGKNQRWATRSDDYGFFQIRSQVEAGAAVSIRVLGEEWIWNAPAKEWTVPLPSPMVLTVQARPPVEPCTITGELLLAEGGGPVPFLRFARLHGGVLRTEGSRFRIQGLDPGKVKLRLQTRGLEELELPEVDLAPGAVADLGSYQVGPASELQLDLDGLKGRRRLPDGSVAVLVFQNADPRRAELEGHRFPLSRDLRDRGKGTRLSTGGLPRGTFELVLRIPGYREVRRQVQLVGPQRRLSIPLVEAPAPDAPR